MLNFVLCDDNLNIVQKLKEMLEILFIKNDIEAKVSFYTDNPQKIIEYQNENHVDVYILDINLNTNMTGIELAQAIRKKDKNSYLIFSTGHLEYSLLAYSVKTFDYLPKPITLERLEITLHRLLDDLNDQTTKKYIQINHKKILNQNDIQYIKKDGMKLIFCTNSGNIESYNSFTKIEHTLPSNFVRCHKSYIANTDNISSIHMNENLIMFQNDLSCEIGPKYKNYLMGVFKNGNIANNLDVINNRK